MAEQPVLRQRKLRHVVPARGDFIEVLWELDNVPGCPKTWCTGEILHAELAVSASDVCGDGVILYPATESWDPVVNVIEFIPGQLLRCTADHDDDDVGKDDCSQSVNPSLSWRYTSEKARDQDVDRSDDEWDPSQQQQANDRGTKRLVEVDEQQGLEPKRLRESNSSLLVEVVKLKRIVDGHSERLYTVEKSLSRQDSCRSVGCVLTRFGRKMALRMQAPLRELNISQTKKTNQVLSAEDVTSAAPVDGIMRGILKARVECTLEQFERLALQIQTRGTKSNVQFLPSFAQTQNPALGSATFAVAFATFTDLCDQVGICPTADRLEMLRKCGTSSNGDLLRMLGTYLFDENDPVTPAWIYIGASYAYHKKPWEDAQVPEGARMIRRQVMLPCRIASHPKVRRNYLFSFEIAGNGKLKTADMHIH